MVNFNYPENMAWAHNHFASHSHSDVSQKHERTILYLVELL